MKNMSRGCSLVAVPDNDNGADVCCVVNMEWVVNGMVDTSVEETKTDERVE